MKICIVRHGSAVSGDVNDQNRSLTDKGLEQTRMAGKWLATQSMSDAACWASPFLRTQQTAQNIADACTIEIKKEDNLIPSGDIIALINQLQHVNHDVILVSHLPLVGHLASYLIDGAIMEQPWSPAECWLLEGEPAGACMTATSVWYPNLGV